MKKQIYFLVSLLALIGFSMNVMGQNEATHQLGEQHSFTVTANSNSDFLWAVYTDAPDPTSGFSTKTPSTNGFTLNGDANTNAVSYTWTTAGVYYVVVKETNKSSSCSTTRYSKVTVEANTYELAVVNEKISSEDGDLTQTTCLAGAGRTFKAEDGITKLPNTVWYHVTLKNGAIPALYTRDSWKVSLKLSLTNSASPTPANVTPTNVTVSCFKADKSAYSGMTLGLNGATETEMTVNKGDGEFYVKLVFDDEFNGTANSDLKIKLDATGLKVGAGNIGENSNASPNNFEYTRNTYPNTGTITIN